MYVYDRANLLAQDIKESPEFIEYNTLKDELFQDETTKDLIKQFKKLQFEAQAAYMSGQAPSDEMMDKLQKLGQVLQLNEKVERFFMAEYKAQTILGDIYKLIGEASGLGTDFFGE